jgi:uncharacterized protein YprB with RNaseH-like and TPR domain
MNIKDKLERLHKTHHVEPVGDYFLERQNSWIENFQTEFDAKIISEKNSIVILKENVFSLNDHTDIDFLRDQTYTFSKFKYLTGESQHDCFNLRESVFVDLETTGLSGGTGTFAFLIGIGHIELDHIIVRQYLIPDFNHEWLALNYLNNLFLSFRNIVSFNGKSYDIPLLKNRFILNKIDSIIEDFDHIDILHLARRLWKRRLKECDLQNLENKILNRKRENDIPGELIPQIYFEFIQKRNAFLLKDILEHNFLDIVNLILLTIKIGRIIHNPIEELRFTDDLFSLAKYYSKNNLLDEALPLYQYLYQENPGSILGKEALFGLAILHKKKNQLEITANLMKKLLKSQKDHPLAVIELAKYYEHRVRDLSAALEVVDQSLKYFELSKQLERDTDLHDIEEDLKYRRKRLIRKIIKKS